MFAMFKEIVDGGVQCGRCVVCGSRPKEGGLIDPVLGFRTVSALNQPPSRPAAPYGSMSEPFRQQQQPGEVDAEQSAVHVEHEHAAGAASDGDPGVLRLASFNDREDFADPVESLAASSDELTQEPVNAGGDNDYMEDLLSARTGLTQALKKERRALQRMRHSDEAAAREVMMKASTPRNVKLAAYYEDKLEMQAKASENLDSVEKSLSSIAAGSTQKGAKTSAGEAVRATNPSASVQAPHDSDKNHDTLGHVSNQKLPSGAADAKNDADAHGEEGEEVDAESLIEAKLAEYDKMVSQGTLKYLKKRMAATGNVPLMPAGGKPSSGDPDALKAWNREMRKRNGQIRDEVQSYQTLMSSKLERIGARSLSPAATLRTTDDPAAAVREAVSRYHKQCLVAGTYYAMGDDQPENIGMDYEQRGEIAAAVSALDLQSPGVIPSADARGEMSSTLDEEASI